jgi:hypothetical protein
MLGRYFALISLALGGALGLAAPALPQDVSAPCALCRSTAVARDEKPAKPVSLAVETSLNFDRLILAGQGNGSAELDPAGGRNVSGSITSIGARAMVGEVVIRGEPGRLVRVTLPASVELHGLSGGSIRLDSIRSDLPPMPRLDGNGELRFRYGGSVRIIGDVDGEFRGNVPLEVDYQ